MHRDRDQGVYSSPPRRGKGEEGMQGVEEPATGAS